MGMFSIEITQTVTTVQEIFANTVQEAIDKANEIVESDIIPITEYQLIDASITAQKADNVIYLKNLTG